MRSMIQRFARNVYVRYVRPLINTAINRQRVKLVWDVWGYGRLFAIAGLTLHQKLTLLHRFLVIDWNVVHAHKPGEAAEVCRILGERPAADNETFLEAGCWKGGSSAKFSIICKMLGYRLAVYDSFQGVEQMSPEAKVGNYDYSGEYASPREVLEENLKLFGEPDVVSITPGWFSNTLAGRRLENPVRVAYLDCDLSKGTHEVLQSVLPALTPDGCVISQDYHITPVRRLLSDPRTWRELGVSPPEIKFLFWHSAAIRFTHTEASRAGGPY